MGEIRSTLELIMERTKGLVITDDDKRKIREKEAEEKVSGIIRRYSAGTASEDDVISNIEAIDSLDKSTLHNIIKKYAIDIIRVEDGKLLGTALFTKIFPYSSDAISILAENVKAKTEEKRKKLYTNMMIKLEDHGIRGDAIVPNIEALDEWKDFLSELISTIRLEIEQLINSKADGSSL